jgi:plastocyanin
MRRLPVLSFTLFGLLALSGCAASTGGTAAPAATAPSAAPAASEPAASAPAAGGGGGCTTSSEAAAVTVNIANFAFDPPEVTAKVGETIGWTNGDSTAHTATTDDAACDTGNIAQNATAGLVFDAAGTYPYHCKIHPNMTGTITITE